jgi:4-hydroxy-tetrahydrodipicolinate synthase
MNFTGVFPILPTPFKPDQSVDLASFTRIVHFMRDLGVDGVTILGVLGEANRLTDKEREAITKVAVTAAGGLPVIVGTSHSGTQACIDLSQMAADLGANAIMVTPHQEAVPNEDRIFEHFAAVANGVPLPMVLQDHPGSTWVNMSLDLVLRMITDIPGVACIKQEALPSPFRVAALVAQMSRKLPILTGLGALYGAFELTAGADGFMTGFAFPEVLVAMVAAHASRDPDRAFAIYQQYLPLMVFEAQPGVAIRKHLFMQRGLIDSDTVRKPASGINDLAATQLSELLSRVVGDVDLTQPISV